MTAPQAAAAQRIALTGAHDLVAGAVLRLLAERDFPVASILAMSDGIDAERDAPWWNEAQLELEVAADADLSGVDLLFLCSPCADAEALLERAVDAGARVIDLIGVERHEDEPLLITPDLEPVPGARAVCLPDAWRRVLRSPDPLALILATVLVPLVREAGLASLRIQCLLPASTLGEPGVRELAGQAENLFNQRDLPEALYGQQIAFNLLAGDAGPQVPLAAVQRDLAALLGDFDAPADLRAIWVPVFFGTAATVWLETSEPLAVEAVLELLRAAPGLVLNDPTADDGPFPTPVEHALDSDAVHVASLGIDGASRRGHVLWVVSDDVRRGRALNGVRIAECLLTLPPAL